jgi:DNA (cytosine-5)-methyltransferase 1
MHAKESLRPPASSAPEADDSVVTRFVDRLSVSCVHGDSEDRGASVRTFLVADLFCGAGGTSTGAYRAVHAMGAEIDLVAVNHWDTAIATHTRGHPSARHFCINLDAANPAAIVEGGRLDLLLASPECVHFSRARGGKPVSDQRRASAYHVQRWVTALNGEIDRILIENVREFMEWGPLLPDGRTDPARKGLYFFSWVNSLVAMGYDWDWRVVNAADFGDATTRERLMVQFVRIGLGGVHWPTPTHGKTIKATVKPRGAMFGPVPELKPWRAAREIIDWHDTGRSLLDDPKYQARPLSIKTRMRIARGLARFGGPLAGLYIQLLGIDPAEVAVPAGRGQKPQPFLLSQQSGGAPRSADEPVSTIASAGYVTVVSPFLIGQHANNTPKGVDEAPVPTIPTMARIRLIEPMLAPYYGSGSGETCQSIGQPVPTIPTKDRFALVDPLAVPYGPRSEARSVAEPLPTVMTRDRLGVATPTAEPFGLRNNAHAKAKAPDEPLPAPTNATSGGILPMEPFIVPNFGEREGQTPRVHDVAAPLPTVTGQGAGAVVRPVLIQTDQTKSNGVCARPIDAPLPTVVTNQTMALVEPLLSAVQTREIDPRRVVLIDGQPYLLDIRFRILKNRELARAMGFDDAESEYEFAGTATQITRQIGNAVCVNLAAALITAILSPSPTVIEAVA